MPGRAGRAQEGKVDVRVLSVLAAAKGKPINDDDLDLSKGGFSVYAASQARAAPTRMGRSSAAPTRALKVGPFYNDLMVDSFASRHPHISWLHAYPGFVKTGLLDSGPWWGSPRLWRAWRPFLDGAR
jgi:hypothetical protein